MEFSALESRSASAEETDPQMVPAGWVKKGGCLPGI